MKLIFFLSIVVLLAQPALATDEVTIRFEGNDLFGRSELLRMAGWTGEDRLSRLSLGRGLKQVAEGYAAFGYLDASFSPDTTRTAGFLELVVVIEEGLPTTLRSVSWNGLDGMDSSEAGRLLGMSVGDVFRAADLESGLRRVLARYAEMGYAYAQTIIESLEREGTKMDLVLFVSEGGIKRLGRIEFEGLDKVRESAAKRWTRLKERGPYNEADLSRAAARLARTGLFEAVEAPEIFSMERDEVGVLFRVKERRRANRLGGAIGVSQDPQDSEANLSGNVDAAFPNIGGSGRAVGLHWMDNGSGRSVTKVDFREPTLFNSPFDLSVNLHRQRQDTISTWQSVGIDLHLPLTLAWTLSGGYSADRDVFERGPVAKTLRHRARLGLRLVPVRLVGRASHEGHIVFEWAQKSVSGRGGNPGSGFHQILYDAGAQKVWTISGPHHLFLHANAKGTISEESVLPLSEQHYLGGARTLRGYREDQFHGREIAYGGLEYRLGDRFGNQLFLFTDIGSFSTRRHLDGADVWTSKLGHGFGVRSRSALGHVELSFGLGEEFSLRSTKVHVALTQEF